MSFYADLHIHSKYSRATSRDCDLENLSYWGRKKGITVIGTGDFTHPAWIAEIKQKLIPAEPGLFRLRPEIEKSISEKLPGSCRGETRFMLSVEISTIYKKGDKTRKVHHLVYAPTIEKAEKINIALSKIGNIRSDGRPILGLDSRDLLEVVLNAGKDCYIVPAHIWTPWFSVLGSKSGFDTVSECYGDLAHHIFAVETGLSSDPEMNWRISHLDRYRLVSNSDAHSPQKLGREACVFETPLDYYAVRAALETGKGYGGTVEFFPEEGKYHMDGHRKCNVRFTPEESRAHNGLCPECKKPLTLGVMYRVEELADRESAHKPDGAADFKSLIPLPEMLSEIAGVGAASQRVQADYEKLVGHLGPELQILNDMPLDEIGKASSSLMAEALGRMRRGEVIRDAGYDGEYGVIKIFREDELKKMTRAGALFEFELPSPEKQSARDAKKNTVPVIAKQTKPAAAGKNSRGPLAGLDPEQRRAAEITDGALLILAGPGSGKTRTLTHRIAHLIHSGKAKPEECLTIAFTRRAAEEMRSRLKTLLPLSAGKIPVTTFHGFGYQFLTENRERLGLPRHFRIAAEDERKAAVMKSFQWPDKRAEKILKELSLLKRSGGVPAPQSECSEAQSILLGAREIHGWLDYDDLLLLTVGLLEKDAGLRALYRKRFPFLSVDEYQDVDDLQYRLIRALADEESHLCAIGDPDQAIYSFRGADVRFFLQFEKDYPRAKKIYLTRNYRSGASILSASSQMIAPSTLAEDREMQAHVEDTGRVVIHSSPTEKAEAEFVVHTIEELIGGLSFFSIDSERTGGTPERAYSFADFAVLYRTEHQADALEEALQRSGIPYQRRAHGRLNENPDIAAFLKWAEAPGRMQEALVFMIKTYQQECAMPEEKAPLFDQLLQLALVSGGDWHKFLAEIALSQESDTLDPRADRVSLLTLHASKALEFPVVFIAGCEDGLIPLSWGNEIKEEELAEERRLFFVGMTRAKDRLFLSHAERRMRQGRLCGQTLSPFLKDIEQKLLERQKTALKFRLKSHQMDLFT